MANFPFLTSLCVALTPFTPSHLPLPQIAASSHPPRPPQPHLHTNKCRGLTWPSLGPWSDPGVIFFFFRRSGAEVTSEVRFGGRLRGGGGWSGWRVVCTGLPHSHSLTGFELVDGSGRMQFPPAGTIRSTKRSKPPTWRLWLEAEVLLHNYADVRLTVKRYSLEVHF